MNPTRPHDDRLLPETRWAALAVFVILVPAAAILWVAPDRTADLWAWPIMPELTSIFLGSGYGAGAYFWTVVYIISPFAVFAIWWRNRATDPRTPVPDDPRVPAGALLAARAFAAGALAVGAVCFVVPEIAVDLWPWQLTPLTARVLACLTVQVGVGALVLSRDPRWSTWRLIVQTFLVATALLLVGAIRAFADFDTGNPVTWLYLGGLTGTAGALVLLHRSTERNRVGPIDPGGSRWPSLVS